MFNKYEIDFFMKNILFEAGNQIKNMMHQNLAVATKKHAHDFVTNIDKHIEQFLVQSIKEKYPDHLIISEEGFGDTASQYKKGIVWGIDPIDGTSNLVYTKKNFAIAVGMTCDGIGQLSYIFDVMNNRLYSSMIGEGCFVNNKRILKRPDRKLEDSVVYSRFYMIDENRYHIRDIINMARGIGCMTCASLGLVSLGMGEIDIMINKGNMKFWDILPGKIFAEELRVKFFTVNGDEYEIGDKNDMIACGPNLYQEVRKLI